MLISLNKKIYFQTRNMLTIKYQYNIVKIALIFLITFCCVCKASRQDNQNYVTKWLVNDLCIAQQKPSKFALFTMITNSKALTKYLQKYARMQCESFDSIYLIVSNTTDTSQYQTNNVERKWAKNLFFIHTQNTSVDNKFLVPSWAIEDVFVVLDQSVQLSCNAIESLFSQWLQRSIGTFGPIGSYFPQNTIYDYEKDDLQYYSPQTPKNAFNLVSLQISIIPKHLLNLYYADIFEFKEMRKLVEKDQICEDIAFNFMVGLIYDEIPSFIFSNYENAAKLSEKFQSSQNPEITKKKTDCVYKFFDICGKIPGKYLFTSDQNDIYQFKDFRQRPLENLQCNALLKKVLIQKKYFSLQSYYRQINKIDLIGPDSKLNEKVQQENKILTLDSSEKSIVLTDKKDQFKYNASYTFSDLIGLNSKQIKQYLKTPKELSESQFQEKTFKLQKLKKEIKNITYEIRKNRNQTSKHDAEWIEVNSVYQQNLVISIFLGVVLVVLVFVAWKTSNKQ